MKTKYLRDGKKVAVISQINETEFIVQEILVSGDKEFPSGKNFIAKNLLDEPIQTWEEKRNIQLRQDCDRLKEQLKTQFSELKKESSIVREKLSYLKRTSKNLNKEVFNKLTSYLAGTYKYIVQDGYSIQILTKEDWKEKEVCKDYFPELRLVSIFGRDDGTFTFKLGQYYDDSGSSTSFMSCNTLKEAISYVQNLVDKEDRYHESHLELEKEYKIKLDPAKKKEFLMRKKADLESFIERKENYIKDYSKDKEEYKQKLDEIIDQLETLTS
jgi:hypothetical protein